MKPNFEWDSEKEIKNIRKHAVSFDEASSVFDDLMFVTVVDEERYITVGLSNKNKLLLVAHTERSNRI